MVARVPQASRRELARWLAGYFGHAWRKIVTSRGVSANNFTALAGFARKLGYSPATGCPVCAERRRRQGSLLSYRHALKFSLAWLRSVTADERETALRNRLRNPSTTETPLRNRLRKDERKNFCLGHGMSDPHVHVGCPTPSAPVTRSPEIGSENSTFPSTSFNDKHGETSRHPHYYGCFDPWKYGWLGQANELGGRPATGATTDADTGTPPGAKPTRLGPLRGLHEFLKIARDPYRRDRDRSVALATAFVEGLSPFWETHPFCDHHSEVSDYE